MQKFIVTLIKIGSVEAQHQANCTAGHAYYFLKTTLYCYMGLLHFYSCLTYLRCMMSQIRFRPLSWLLTI